MNIPEQIRTIIHDLTGQIISDDRANLLNPHTGVNPVDLIYVIDRMETEFEMKLFPIFSRCDHTVLTIDKLSEIVGHSCTAKKI